MKTNKHSHINADEEQVRLLELQRKTSREDRPLSVTLTALFFAFIFVFAILFWVLPDKELSENENRSLTTLPKFTFSALADGSYTEKFADYMADQFPFRDFFVNLKAASEKVMLKGQNNGVILARDGYLVTRYDKVDEKTLRNKVSYISEFMKNAEGEGLSVTFAAAGRTSDVALTKISPIYGTEASDGTWELFNSVCKENGVSFVDLRTPLREHFESGEYVYYKTDHHWTSLGAYYAYREITAAAGLKCADVSDFERVAVTDSFYGTTWSSAGITKKEADTIELFRFDGDEKIERRMADRDEVHPLYEMSALETKDKYAVFTGDNTSIVRLSLPGENREKLLIIKDSFANSVVPMLLKDYDVIMLDLRYYSQSIWELCKNEGIGKIILIYNMDSLSDNTNLALLKAQPK